MAWITIDRDGTEKIHHTKPTVNDFGQWGDIIDTGIHLESRSIELPKGSISRLIGSGVCNSGEPMELTESILRNSYFSFGYFHRAGEPAKVCEKMTPVKVVYGVTIDSLDHNGTANITIDGSKIGRKPIVGDQLGVIFPEINLGGCSDLERLHISQCHENQDGTFICSVNRICIDSSEFPRFMSGCLATGSTIYFMEVQV